MATEAATTEPAGVLGFHGGPSVAAFTLPVPPGYPGVLADWQLREALARRDDDPLRLRIDPFVPEQLRAAETPWAGGPTPTVSYGLSCAGYDLRLAATFRRMRAAGGLSVSLFTPWGEYVGPRPIDPFYPADVWDDPVTAGPHDAVLVPPHGVLLGETVERVRMPDDCIAVLLTKSTWARCGLFLNCTPLEPGWAGTVTVEIANLTGRPVRVYPGGGIGQMVLLRGGRVEVPYHARPGGGTYMDQAGPTPPRLGPQTVADVRPA